MSMLTDDIIINDRLDVTATGRIITTTKGDLIADDGTHTVRLPIGTNGQIFQVDSTQTTGFKWKTGAPGDVGLGNVTNTLNNFSATTNPTTSNDSSQGYSVGSKWVNTTSGEVFTCTNASIGAALWTNETIADVLMSNVGSGGVGVFKQKVSNTFQMKNINVGSNKLSITDDVGNNTVDLDLVPGNVNINSLLNAPSGAVVGTTDTQTLTNKTFGDNLNMNSNKIINLATPTAATDAANKTYVDSVALGLDVKLSVRAASTTDLSGNTSVASYSYNATGGTSGRGQITGTLNVSNTFTLDGVTINAAGNGTRILLKDQTSGAQNGIWTTTISGTSFTLDRATDFDADSKVTTGAFTFVEEGTTLANQGWILTTANPITIGGAGGTSLTFTQFTGAGEITAGNGLSKTGNTLNVVGSATIISGASVQVNSSATANQILLSSGTVGTASTFGALPLGNTNSVTGVLGLANGGTNTSSYTGDRLTATNAGNTAIVSTTIQPSQVVTLTGTQTLTNKTLTTPIITGSINDSNSNSLISLTSVASAVNQVTVANAATGNAPSISATGTDTNINLNINAKGTGNVTLSNLKYPNADGSANQVLATNGAGTLSFVNVDILTTNTITTTDATVTTITTIATVSGTTYCVDSTTAARRTDSGSETGGWFIKGVFKNIGGTLTKLGDNRIFSKDVGAWDVQLTTSGTNIIITVKGENSKTINWKTSSKTVTV